MVAGAGTQSSRRSAKQFSIRAKCFQGSANLVKKIQLGAQGSRAESPKDNSPGQSESASDALGQPSIKFPSPERALKGRQKQFVSEPQLENILPELKIVLP